MSQLRHARSFRDLIAYQKAQAVVKRIFEVTKRFPREVLYALTDQVMRSSRSVGAQIAEAWARLRYEKHFISKLTDADAEQLEIQHRVDTASDCGYLTGENAGGLSNDLAEVGRMLGSMIEKAASFCGDPSSFTLHEFAADYLNSDGEEK